MNTEQLSLAEFAHYGQTPGEVARDTGMAATEDADTDQWDTRVIDTAIKQLCQSGRTWSANDLRELLPEVRQPLIGARVRAAARRKQIVHAGYTPSSLASTHAHDIKTWRAA